jgi:hypothetical protein
MELGVVVRQERYRMQLKLNEVKLMPIWKQFLVCTGPHKGLRCEQMIVTPAGAFSLRKVSRVYSAATHANYYSDGVLLLLGSGI